MIPKSVKPVFGQDHAQAHDPEKWIPVAGQDHAQSEKERLGVVTGPEVLDVARDAIITIVIVSAPLMLVGLAVGVAISLFQALTQIQEMTLVFVPKILAIFVAMLVALPFMADVLQGHMTRIAARIAGGRHVRRGERRRIGSAEPHARRCLLLPALAAAYLLVFARIGTMIMLLPGFGEMSVPVRVRLAVALLLTAMFLPLHREAYAAIDLRAYGPVLLMLGQELLVGAVLGMTARLTISALSVAGAVVAQQMGLGFVTAVDPTQGQQNVIVGNFLTVLGVTLIFATDLHHLVIAALNDSYRLFAPGEMILFGDIAALVTKTVSAAFRVGIQLSAPFLVFGLAVQYRARRALAPDAADAGVLRRHAAVDPARLRHPPDGHRHDDGDLHRIPRRRFSASSRLIRDGSARWPRTTTIPKSQKTQPRNGWTMRSSAATSPRARRCRPGSSSPARRWCWCRFPSTMGTSLKATLAGLLANSWRIPADGGGLIRLTGRIGIEVIAAIAIPLLLLMLAAVAGNVIQHRLVWSARKPQAQTRPRLAARRPEAAVLQTRAGQFRQRPAQARA